MRSATNIKIIPPLIPLATMSMGAALHFTWPVPIIDVDVVRWAGWMIVLLSFVPAACGVYALRTAGTTLDVRRRATELVTHGIFQYTRNPMYLALLALCVGLAMAVNSLLMLLLVVPTGSLLCLLVIRKEEAALQSQFGEPYVAYKGAVRRWV